MPTIKYLDYDGLDYFWDKINAKKQDKLTAGSNITISGNTISATQPTKTSQLTNDSGFITSSSLSGYLPLTGGTLTGKLTGTQIETGTAADNYFQARKFRGQGDASSYYHAIDFGYGGHDQVDFYEYGGVWNFWRNTSATATTDTNNLALGITLNALKNKAYTYTFPNKTGTFALTSDLPTVNNGTLTIQKNGTNVQTFTANQSGNATANITVPTKTSELTNDSNFATDSNVVHKTGTETITGEKTFSNTKLKVMGDTAESRFNFYAERRLGALQVGTSYANWESSKKDGTWHRIWKLAFPTGVNFWGRLTIGLTGSWSNFNASGYMEKQINLAFNGSNLYNNVGRYSALGLNVEKDFRISECIWNAGTSQWEIYIYSHQPQGNNAPRTIVLKCESYQESLVTAFEGITVTASPEISQVSSYVNPKATVSGASKTFYFADLPTFQDPYGREILNEESVASATTLGGIKVGNNLTISSDGTLSANASAITVDSALSTTSTNPVQNKVITTELNNKADTSDMSTALAAKQDRLTAGAHINITGSTIKAVDYVHSDDPVSTTAVTPVVTNNMIADGTITADKFATGATLKLTLSTSDIGEGAALAANTLYGVYS